MQTYGCTILKFVACIIDSDMALYINGNHILYYCIDSFIITILEYSYFKSPDCLVVQGWIRATLFFPTSIILAGPIFYQYIKVVVRYFNSGFYDVSCHYIVAGFGCKESFCSDHITNSVILNLDCLNPLHYNKLCSGYSLIMSGINKSSMEQSPASLCLFDCLCFR